MKNEQSKRISLLEASANTIIGILVAFILTQTVSHSEEYIQIVWPSFRFHIDYSANAAFTILMTGVSLLRSYFVRRVFTKIKLR